MKHTPALLKYTSIVLLYLPLVGGLHAQSVSLTDGVSINPQSGIVTLSDGTHRVRFTPQIAWEQKISSLKRPGYSPYVQQHAEGASVTLEYPQPADRLATLRIDTLPEKIGTKVTTTVANNGTGSHPEYFFWSFDLPNTQIEISDLDGQVKKIDIDPKEWSRFGSTRWIYLSLSDSAGLAIVTNGNIGKGPLEGGFFYLHPMVREQEIAPGQTYGFQFACALVKNIDEAKRLAEQSGTSSSQNNGSGVQVDYGKPATDWVREARNANGYYRPVSQWTDEVIDKQLSNFDYIIGSTPDKNILERMHKRGIKLFHYVLFVELLDTHVQVRDGSAVYPEWSESILNEERDLSKNPDWLAYDRDGNPHHSIFGKSHNHPGLFYVCFHQKGLREAALRQVRKLMEMGFDGVFIDLAFNVVECFGDKHGKHEHADAAKSNTQMYFQLLDDIYKEVKSFGEDRAVIVNGALPSNWARSDAVMWESCIFEPGKSGRINDPSELIIRAQQYREAVKAGKELVLLSFIPSVTPEDKKRVVENTLYAFSYGWAHGFTVMDYFAIRDADKDFAEEFYRVKLVPNDSDPLVQGMLITKEFKNGFVVWNGSATEKTVPVPDALRLPEITLSNVGFGEFKDGEIVVPPESGRILFVEDAKAPPAPEATSPPAAMSTAIRHRFAQGGLGGTAEPA